MMRVSQALAMENRALGIHGTSDWEEQQLVDSFDMPREYPDINLRVRDRTQAEVLAAIRAGNADFGLAIDPAPSRELVIETILEDPDR